jgi:PAS domain-containing protein
MFKDRSLKRLGLYLLAGMCLIFLTEYVIIRYKIEVLEEVEEKKDFARSGQLAGQQIALLVQEYLHGQGHLSAELGSKLDEKDHLMKVLREGGRIDGTDVFIKPLSRLPRITFDQLEEAWSRYRENVLTVLVRQAVAGADSTDSTAVAFNPQQVAKARALLPAQWITLSNWYRKLEIDLTEEADNKKNSVETWVFSFILLDLILLALLYFIFHRYVIKPIASLESDTKYQRQNFHFNGDEIGRLRHEVNEILEQLKDATDFVGAIGEGKLDFDYKNLDNQYAQGKNKLADSLIAMQTRLKDMNLEEQRRQWANEGLTKFVDILRSSNNDIHLLGDRIISALVQYTGSNQGGLYVLNDEDENNKYLEMISLFAFDNKKFGNQKIKLGEGILGQTFLEKETTVLNELPDEYIRITSGLGDANPRALVIVPLKVDKDVYGIVELASFKNYQEYEIQFVEKLAETIASTLASVRVAQKNMDLIEQFQQQTEQMRAQEEEMRQNMEELQATQEEMARKERAQSKQLQSVQGSEEDLKNKIAEIGHLKEQIQLESGARLELSEKFKKDIIEILNQIPAKIFLKDAKGNLILCNNAVADDYNLPLEKIIGTHDRDHFDPEQVKIWEAQEAEIKREGKKTFVQEQRLDGKVRYFSTTKMPFVIHHLNQTGLMGFQMDITDTMNTGKAHEPSDDWAVAEELAETLKVQLEALRISQEEFPGK